PGVRRLRARPELDARARAARTGQPRAGRDRRGRGRPAGPLAVAAAPRPRGGVRHAMAWVYLFHVAFYAPFLFPALDKDPAPDAPPAAPPPPAPQAAHPARLVLLHSLAFAVLYFGLGGAVWSRQPTRLLFASHPVAGAAIMAGAILLLAWALLVFRSWR